jgi:tetratricopeptide (TPR) repeat protein
LDQLEDGLADIQESLKRDNKNGWAYRNRGIYYLETGQPALALKDFQTATKLTYNIESIHYYLGLAYERTGDKRKACEEWSLAKKLGEKEAELLSQETC